MLRPMPKAARGTDNAEVVDLEVRIAMRAFDEADLVGHSLHRRSMHVASKPWFGPIRRGRVERGWSRTRLRIEGREIESDHWIGEGRWSCLIQNRMERNGRG